jgi:spermidine/putrescine transport system permease protein
MIISSFNKAASLTEWHGFSLKWYKQLLNLDEVKLAAWHTLVIALASSTLSLVLGTMFAIRTNTKQEKLAGMLFLPNLIFPDIVIAIGILSIFKALNLTLGFTSLVIGHTVIGLVFVVPIIRTKYLEINRYLLEASADLGAGGITTFRKVTLPLLKPALVSAGLMAFTLSLDDFIIAFFCSGNGDILTLSLFVYHNLRRETKHVISALSACIVLLSALLVFGTTLVQNAAIKTGKESDES